MRTVLLRYLGPVLAFSAALCVACGDADEPIDSQTGLPLVTQSEALAMSFHANLRATNEVAFVDSNARGQALLDASNTSELFYRLIVANIADVVAAHIHCAPAGTNGPVGVTLFKGGPISPNGILSEGSISMPDAGNGCGWADVANVIDAIVAGNAYVNVHTLAYPGGEIRGQLR